MINRNRWMANLLMLAGCCIISVALCAPAFNRLFASDDYCTLDNIVRNNSVLIPGFFRPVADVTLLWTYKLTGLSPFYFFLTNALLHGLNAWLVYLLAGRVTNLSGLAEKKSVPVFAAFIFLFYHSVGEVVFWAIGRGISLAITLSLLASLLFFSELNRSVRYAGVSILYLIALCSYESIMMLPLILVSSIYFFRTKENPLTWLFLFAVAAGINIFMRVQFTGKLWSAYGGEVFDKNFSATVETFIKSFARVLMPSVDSPPVFVAGVLFIFGVITSGMMVAWQKYPARRKLLTWSIVALVGAVLPAMFYGASTRTIEGDRFLYFPAVFFAIILAYLVSSATGPLRSRVLMVLICLTGVISIIKTRDNWMRADLQVRIVVEQLSNFSSRPLYVSGLPGDFRGAYQFRNCWQLAIQYNGVPESASIFAIKAGTVPPPHAASAYWNGSKLVFQSAGASTLPPDQ